MLESQAGHHIDEKRIRKNEKSKIRGGGLFVLQEQNTGLSRSDSPF